MSDQHVFGGRQAGKTARLAQQARAGAGTFERGINLHKSVASVLEQRPLRVHDGTFDEAARIDQHMIDAALYGTSTWRLPGLPEPRVKLDEFTDAELVMHMIGRGYAVMKLPADGGPPETLR